MRSIRRRVPSVFNLLITVSILVNAGSPFACADSELTESSGTEGFKTEPTGNLALGSALSQALAQSPSLSVYNLEIRAREAAALQAGLLPNPEIKGEIENFGGSKDQEDFETAESTILFAQQFELAGKRPKRREVSEQARNVAASEFDAARLEVINATTKAFIDALIVQERLAFTDELLASSRNFVRIAEGQVKAGAASEVELLRTEVAVGQLEAARDKLEVELQAAYAALANNWGSGSVHFSRVTGNIDSITPPPPLGSLVDRISETPGIRRWVAESREKEAVLSLERAKAVPDLTVGLGGRHFSDDDSNALVAEISHPLPLFDRNQGGIEEASYRLKKVEAERKNAVRELTAALRAAHAEMSGAYAEISKLRQTVVPKAKAALSGARESYERGVFRALDVLDAQRTVFGVREHYLQGLAVYHRARAELDKLSGLSETKSVNLPEPR